MDPRSPRAGARLIEHNHLLGVDGVREDDRENTRIKMGVLVNIYILAIANKSLIC